MSRMNGITRKKLYSKLIFRDGEFCKGCGKLSFEGQLVIDHRNNNNSMNDLDNLQLLCRSCNYIKNPKRPVDECVSESSLETEIQINRTKEPQFKEYVGQRVNEEEKVPEIDLINSGAELLHVSPVTTKRYLNKMCSSLGIYQKITVGNTVVVKYKEEIPFI